MPVVESTYAPKTPQAPQQLTTWEVETKAEKDTHRASTENDAPQKINSHEIEQPSTDKDNTKVQHGSLRPDNKDKDTTENIVYYDANQFWKALKIMRQSRGKGKTQYLIQWEDGNYPDTWSNASDVDDELKRVFYLTHMETGARCNKPLQDTAYTTLSMIHARDAVNTTTTIMIFPQIKPHKADVETDHKTHTLVYRTHQERTPESQPQPTSTVDSLNQNAITVDKNSKRSLMHDATFALIRQKSPERQKPALYSQNHNSININYSSKGSLIDDATFALILQKSPERQKPAKYSKIYTAIYPSRET